MTSSIPSPPPLPLPLLLLLLFSSVCVCLRHREVVVYKTCRQPVLNPRVGETDEELVVGSSRTSTCVLPMA
jgi:hypothetical protein